MDHWKEWRERERERERERGGETPCYQHDLKMFKLPRRIILSRKIVRSSKLDKRNQRKPVRLILSNLIYRPHQVMNKNSCIGSVVLRGPQIKLVETKTIRGNGDEFTPGKSKKKKKEKYQICCHRKIPLILLWKLQFSSGSFSKIERHELIFLIW